MKADIAIINGLLVDSKLSAGVLYIKEGKIIGSHNRWRIALQR